MTDRPALNEDELQARNSLVVASRAMLSEHVCFIEGALLVLDLRGRAGGVGEQDKDFQTFVAIASETDHLPLMAQRPYWDAAVLRSLEPEYEIVQKWARTFARESCASLIARFAIDE